MEPSHDPALLLTVRTSFGASTIVAVLRDAGIEAIAVEKATMASEVPLGPAARGIPVLVPHADLERSRAALAECEAASSDIDWDEVDLGPRADALPLHKPGRMPMAARVAFVIAVIVALVSAVAGGIALVMS